MLFSERELKFFGMSTPWLFPFYPMHFPKKIRDDTGPPSLALLQTDNLQPLLIAVFASLSISASGFPVFICDIWTFFLAYARCMFAFCIPQKTSTRLSLCFQAFRWKTKLLEREFFASLELSTYLSARFSKKIARSMKGF